MTILLDVHTPTPADPEGPAAAGWNARSEATGERPMTAGQPLSATGGDPRSVRILAKTIYRDLRQAGLAEQDVMCLAGELLSLVTGDMRNRRPPSAT